MYMIVLQLNQRVTYVSGSAYLRWYVGAVAVEVGSAHADGRRARLERQELDVENSVEEHQTQDSAGEKTRHGFLQEITYTHRAVTRLVTERTTVYKLHA